MQTGRRPFEKFIRRVHRRHLLVHLLERAALGILGGCAAAIPLLGIAIWRGLPGLPLAIAALILGILAGLLWGIITRPSTFAAAMEADRQLGWADLISSAMMVRSRPANDPWAETLRAIADAHCRTALPSTIVLNRLGARAWGGMGLATALVLVLALLPTHAAPTRAGDNRTLSERAAAETQEPASLGQTLAPSNVRRTPAQDDPDDPNASRMSEAEPPPKTQDDSSAETLHQRGATAPSADPYGHGAGASHSDSSQPPGLDHTETATHSRDTAKAGKASGGVGESAMNDAPGIDASGQSAGMMPGVARQTPPWQTSEWAAESRRAMKAVDDGQIPDAYRDVMRGYFERP